MNKDLLAKEVIKILGVSESEKELALDLFLSKLADSLNKNETIKISDLGLFHIKDERVGKKTVLYSPQSVQSVKESGALYVTFDVDTEDEQSDEDFDDSVFSIGIGKPLVPVTKVTEDEDFSKSILKKSINQRIGELIADAVKLDDFDLWSAAELSKSETEEEVSEEELQSLEAEVNESEDSETEFLDKYDDSVDEIELIEENEQSDKVEEVELSKEEDEFVFVDELELSQEKAEEVKEEEKISESKIESDESELSDSDSELLDSLLKEQDEVDDVETDNEDGPKIEWNWGDELKEEFLSKDDLDEIKVDVKEEVFEETVEKPVTDEELPEEDDELVEEEIDEEVKVEDIPEEEITESIDEQISENVEEEKKEDEEEAKYESGNTVIMEDDFKPMKKPEGFGEHEQDQDDEIAEEESNDKPTIRKIKSFRDRTNKGDWKKVGFGRSFWIILALFLIIAVISIYIFMFDDSSQEMTVADSTNVPVEQPTEDGVKDSVIAAFLEDEKNSATVETTNNTADKKEPPKQETTQPRVEQTPERVLDTAPQIRVISNEQRINGNVYFDGNKYMLQVASFKAKSRAERQVRTLRQQGHNAFIVEANLPQLGGTWYRVRIGDFDTQRAAQDYLVKHKF